MVFAVAGGGQLDTGYTIDNSLRFNDGDGAYLNRTPSTTSNRQVFTLSGWFKRGVLGGNITVFAATSNETNSPEADEFFLRFNSSDELNGWDYAGGYNFRFTTTAVYRDVSAWYHIVYRIDTTAASSSDRVRLYINGVLQTLSFSNSPSSQNFNTQWNVASQIAKIGRLANYASQYYDGYVAEVYHVDGQSLDPTSFGEFDADSGIWKPKQYTGSYGTNGFYLDFEDSGSLGADQSGNGNNFTPTNLASTDQTTDTPTNNFCTLILRGDNGLSGTLIEGNLAWSGQNTNAFYQGTHGFSSGKWYWEVKNGSGSGYPNIGVITSNHSGYISEGNDSWRIWLQTGDIYGGQTQNGSLGGFSDTDILNVAVDADNGKIYFGKNGSWWNSGNPATSTNPSFSNLPTGEHLMPAVQQYRSANFNFGNPPATFTIASGNSDANGYGNFEYSVPSGFLALCTQNLATELTLAVDKSDDYFNSLIWTGNGSTRDITGLDFQPDWVWTKSRGVNRSHKLYDSSRGVYKALESDTTDYETSFTAQLQSFNSDGFGLGSGVVVNNSGEQYVGWCWKSGGGSTSTNNDGGITSTVQADTTSGFSIALYTGTGTASSFGHGLGVAPKVVIVKSRSNGGSYPRWYVQHPTTGPGKVFFLDIGGNVITNSNYWGTAPDSSKVYIGNDIYGPNVNGSSNVAYCFAEIEGFSKFGTYTGNGNSDGPFIYTGFKPAFILLRSITTTQDYNMFDNVRNPFNVVSNQLRANQNFSEDSGYTFIDILSNGFKCRNTASDKNQNGVQYIYFAFAGNPFITSTGVAGTAR